MQKFHKVATGQNAKINAIFMTHKQMLLTYKNIRAQE